MYMIPRRFSIEQHTAIVYLLFSAHISYGKGKYLNQTGFFYKICQDFIYI